MSFKKDRTHKRVGVTRKQWASLGPVGRVACSRMWDELGRRSEGIMPTGYPAMDRNEWSIARHNISIAAGMVAREMAKDEDSGIAKWIDYKAEAKRSKRAILAIITEALPVVVVFNLLMGV